jgi:beta-glucanase (GH16 family)
MYTAFPRLRALIAPVALALLAALAMLLAGQTVSAGAASPVGPTSQAWTQVFDDEFSGSSLDQSRWYPNRWFAASCAKGATSNELQYYTGRSSNVSVAAGSLHLTARREAYYCGEASWSGNSAYTSGWVQTGGSRASDGSTRQPGFTMGLGYVEARIKLPRGKGLWPAVWMLQTYRDGAGRQQYPTRPEIDNLEVLGDSTKTWRFNVHLPGADQGSNYAGPDTSTGWHTIGVWRRADRIDWFVDGKPTWSYSGPSVPAPDIRMYVVLNLAVGGDWPGAPDAATGFPAEMLVDYLRAWEPASPAPSSLAPANPPRGIWQPLERHHLLVARGR